VSGYSPHTAQDVAAMLEVIGAGSIDELFAHVPANLRARATIALPAGMTEPELRRHLGALASRNGAGGPAVFLGAGAYPHWVPSVVDQVLLRSEFATAYTPYQPEVSQGTLQAIFEFQTFSALLLGLEVANASMYDGASATAEAVLMARRLLPGRRVIWLSRALHPHYRDTVVTYLRGLGDVEVRELPFGTDGRTDLEALRSSLGPDTLCAVLGYPNVFGGGGRRGICRCAASRGGPHHHRYGRAARPRPRALTGGLRRRHRGGGRAELRSPRVLRRSGRRSVRDA
jgi:glycine dehydrogenase subunit 1